MGLHYSRQGQASESPKKMGYGIHVLLRLHMGRVSLYMMPRDR
jgi:hypothetical protein